MRRITLIIAAMLICIVSIGAERREPHQETIDWQAQGFQKIKVTAYCCGTHTATGVPVHYGCMAVSRDHLGDCAYLYTVEGDFIDLFEGNDQGGTDAIRNGYVVDIYFPTLDECKAFMSRTGGVAYIKYVPGVG